MDSITWTEGKNRDTKRQRITAHVPVHPEMTSTIRRHIAFINQKNDGRYEVTLKKVKPTDVFQEPRWQPTFDQRVFHGLIDAKTAVEQCWHEDAAALSNFKPIELYLIVLEGQGDVNVKLVTKPVWDWINSDYNSEKEDQPGDNCYYEAVPDAVMADARRFKREHWFEGGRLRITKGSYSNDRALAAPGAKFEDEEDARAFGKDSVVIAGEYEGYLY